MAKKGFKKTYSTVTVADQKEYPLPANTMSIKRLELDGLRCTPISFAENDDMIVANDATTGGSTDFYYQWDGSFFFGTAPATSGLTIKIYSYSMPQAVENTSTIEIPGEYHLDLVTYVTYCMAAKDENPQAAGNYLKDWVTALRQARKLERRKLTGDEFKSVTVVS